MNDNHNLETINNLSSAMISWYPFEATAKILLLAAGDSAFDGIADGLRAKGLKINTEIDDQKYDYVILMAVVERQEQPADFLKKIRACLNDNGKLFIGVYNRLAIRHFLGDKDPYTGKVFDGVEDYINILPERMAKIGGRCYSKREVEQFLAEAGFDKTQAYSVMPSLERPQLLLRSGYKPNEKLDVRVAPQYISPESVFMFEERLYESLLENDMFHQMANGYLFECSLDGKLTEYDQITVQGDRAPDEAMATLIRSNQYVEKRALYSQGECKLKKIYEKNEELKAHSVPVVDVVISENGIRMPFVDGEIATKYLRDCLREGREIFLKEIHVLKDIIENSSEHVAYNQVDWTRFEPGWEKRKEDDPNLHKWELLANGTEEEKAEIGVILKHGYIDMVSLNCFHTKSGYLFFDQEFNIENLPANAILIRTIDLVYRDCPELSTIYPVDELLKELNLFTHARVWRGMGRMFLEHLRSEKELAGYHRKYRRDNRIVTSNRLRMNYTQEEYDSLFRDIFKGIDNKQIYLFGSGRFAEQFIDQFGQFLSVAGVIDNNSEKWGKKIQNIEIISPDSLKNIAVPYKVIICIKNYEDVLEQLKDMGIMDLSVYSPSLEYERPVSIAVSNSESEQKPYHIGYVAGVFDVFHVGHLNLLKKAKAQCDYLIVGIVSDEQVIKSKKTKPYMSFEERREIVAACKYVDEAVKIPFNNPSTEFAWRMYHFDAQFSGSDYENDPLWLANREFLRQHGSDLVFFPYTESVSSTMLKKEIREKNNC